ncbi:c-type cytochrome biogenesis protein CcsB [Heyndrickxia sporothermodurans]|nr:c-type cytochrome biogenesis protein CcsB [Heyndrickxia sporothermodurans]
MTAKALVDLSSTALYISFIIYLLAMIPFGLSIKSRKNIFSKIAVLMTMIGFIFQLVYFATRWYVAGHAPVSNLYEFMTFFGIMLVGSFLIFNFLYHQNVVGLFVLPLALIILGYANAFSKDISPLIPALQSKWLTIHVITVAFASAVLSISFATSVIYLLKKIDIERSSLQSFFLEFIMYLLVVILGFITITTSFNLAGYSKKVQFENKQSQVEIYEYKLPIIVAPKDSILQTKNSSLKEENIPNHIFTVPNLIDAQKLNTIIWSFLVGSILYLLFRLFSRRKISSLLKPLTNKVNLVLMDEITYRVIIIGFPLFALGGLIFAMIWAQLAWSRFWGWDPKEVWALITFLFYTAFLHLRLSKGWEGEKTSWLAIIGFGIIVFNQVFVNLIISGLHSYA